MMKKTLFFLSLGVTLAACNNHSGDAAHNDSTIVVAQATGGEVALDTLTLGNQTIFMYPLSASSFAPDEDIPMYSDSLEQLLLTRDTGLVKKEGDSLWFVLDSGEGGGFKSHANAEEDDNYTRYYYSGFLKDIGYYCVAAAYYEGGEFFLVDKKTGKPISTWSEPLISPDKQSFVCYSFDIEAGFVSNGIQLFKMKNGQAELVGQAALTNWGPSRMKWLDNKTLEAEYSAFDSTGGIITKPVKLVLQ